MKHVSTVLEASMVMGWFVVLLLGEKAVSSATEARRSAETAAEESATKSSADQCRPQSATVGGAPTSLSVVPSRAPDVRAAVAMTRALGLGQQRTFPSYERPLQSVVVRASSPAAGKTFESQRELGCLEEALDTPAGSMAAYRARVWTRNLQGY